MSNNQSILENHPLLREDFATTGEFASGILAEWMRGRGLDDEAVKAALSGGATPAAVMGLERQHIDALYTKAYDFLEVGNTEGARSVLTTLLQLEPTNERAVYAMAASHQLDGNLSRAAEIYAIYTALDATNPLGYLRVGECLLGLGEAQTAYETFDIAAAEAARGNGDPGAEHLARTKMAEAIEAGADPTASKG
ncbi:MAG: hypothetical protein AAF318_01380 [Pseudomonadota bacterium]